MEVSKIHLSSAETELMQNAEIILTKNRVLAKIKSLLEEVQNKQTTFVQDNNPAGENEIFRVSPKISRGENYLGLPYLILDHPRQSSGNHFFFIRTMFWWGRFFSCTLHLARDSREMYKGPVKNAFAMLKNYYISINYDQWSHHLGETDFRKIGSMTRKEFEEACENFGHIKIAARLSLGEWERSPTALFENWKIFLSVCGLIA